ncbi:hypothetical protein M2459_002700 [Parabacteroides sp. PF5-5]|uniref:Ig-like domain-containing protein n=1 Tax=unclassified Parabacteroides TaxID=2649774 RepID=UPI0024743B68|nr:MULTISPECIES: Ig-like domain-containing protein [unclassified Parabacteroides]MDH6305913.1 hypothetical protein [Parabacteroides sp. PH5-39]MDH6316872.1 hypothetical protein [Parabacteroides sp. PF5-13]MDH6320625.1 hypothetical protein [Parabacteroides sp. PH5-13]MDH6324454.1 hypothetical protein [Parabacteroides sp. PH5-8]MDH6328057.1 hypothetical protein [Parabacteroides sp. PH5-41]
MKIQYIKKNIPVFIGLCTVFLIYSCANVGTPNGGPYDEDPPKFISSTPTPNQVNYKGKKVEILFDELIQLDKPSENVIVTPPQLQMPVVRAAGKKVTVELKDTLKDNTTYTVDFTNSIADNNEKNVFENFTFAFSTGDVIDSLEVSGYLLNAENLEPMQGITIGLHNNLEDTAFTKEPFIRTSRTNEKGKFVIRNIAPGTYRIFALNDVNRDYKFDQAGEDIAFCDSLIIPTFEFTSRQDTLWKDTLTIDTIKTVHYTRFMPDDIELRLFKEDFKRQYILRPERQQENMFTLRFNAELDTMPHPIPLNFTPAQDDWYFPQWAEEDKAVNYWLTDPEVWQQDTLKIEVTYPKSDSLNVLQPQTDTLTAAIRRMPEPKKKKKNDEPEPIVFLGMTIDASGSMDISDTVSILFSEPVLDVNKEWFSLSQKVDTVWIPAEFEFFPDSTNSLGYFINRKWNYGEEFRLEVDSAAIFSIYGKWNDPKSQTFKIKNEDEYGHFYLNINGLPTDSTVAFVELLNSSDVPLRKGWVEKGGVLFMNLKPDKYYVRLVIDENENFKWDTGNYAEKRQPEKVIYCPSMFNIMKNWEVEESWDINAATFTKQKPLDITKNKPKEVTKQKRDHRNEGRQTKSRSSGSSGTGMPF